MYAKLEDWKNGWSGLELGIRLGEIDQLIASLKMLRDEPEQHFHLSSDYQGSGGIGDIVIFIQPDDGPHNMTIGGRALAPGEIIGEDD